VKICAIRTICEHISHDSTNNMAKNELATAQTSRVIRAIHE
jgi:hypothetical protein